MNQVRSQVFPGDVARLRRLGALITFIAGLPEHGAHVLVGTPGAKHELSDLILQYRGTAVSNGTRIVVGGSAGAEKQGVAGIEPERVFAAPGYVPFWAILNNSARPSAAENTQHIHIEVNTRAMANVLAAWTGPQEYQRGAPQAPMKIAVPGALRHAWPSPVEAPATGRPPAWTEAQPSTAPAGPAPGPWQKPEFKARPPVDVVIKSYCVAGGSKPYRLMADLPPGCGGAYHGGYDTQAEADAALPGFVRYVRGIFERHAARDDTISFPQIA